MLAFGGGPGVRLALPVTLTTLIFPPVTLSQFFVPRTLAQTYSGNVLPWCINTGKSLIPLTLRFFAQKRNLLIPLELSRVMHQGSGPLQPVKACNQQWSHSILG